MADVPHFSRATGDSLMTPGAPLWRPYRKRPLLLHDPKGGGTGSAERGPGVAGAVFRTTLVVQESSFRRLNSSTISPSRRGRRGGEVQAETVCSRRRRAPAATPSPCRSSLVTRRDCTDRVLRAGRSAHASAAANSSSWVPSGSRRTKPEPPWPVTATGEALSTRRCDCPTATHCCWGPRKARPNPPAAPDRTRDQQHVAQRGQPEHQLAAQRRLAQAGLGDDQHRGVGDPVRPEPGDVVEADHRPGALVPPDRGARQRQLPRRTPREQPADLPAGGPPWPAAPARTRSTRRRRRRSLGRTPVRRRTCLLYTSDA